MYRGSPLSLIACNMKRVIRILLWLIFLWTPPLFAQVQFYLVPKETLLQRLAVSPLKNTERQAALVKMFADVGCKAELQPVKDSGMSNVICILPGASTDTIIVGGHVDKVEVGNGIVDDWSGASMLPTLYESLKTIRIRHTVIFVGFADEEKGLLGSKYYVKQMTPEARTRAKEMINLECLGMNPTEVWASHSDRRLLNALFAVAQAMKVKVSEVNVERVGTADSESFAAAKIPRTTIHSVDQKTLSVLHSPQDNLLAINPDFYYESYRLIAEYLATIDAQNGVTQPGDAVAATPGNAITLKGTN